MSSSLSGLDATASETFKTAVVGGGCFWCTEAIFQRVDGVSKVVSGFAGGDVDNPTYKQVVGGRTGHAEVIQITYDPSKVSYPELLDIFLETHDPTTPNRQGNDIGPQYRSIILYQDDEQKQAAEAAKQKFNGIYQNPVVTEIKPLEKFYPAEDYHQDYFANNPGNPYCSLVIAPKVRKFEARQEKEAARK
ncbi:MAG: peptide-methionine (S)-S-oxide reductase MsrA [Verrucomicrobiota bacterium]